jgi:LuxR family maltose regulon positive regulatory protein
MDTELLTTKLFTPQPGPNLVLRPRLAALLAKSPHHCLTLVSAPAGYGKTSLVSSWLQDIAIPSAWISLDETENDPKRFLQYLLAALYQAIPGLQPGLANVLQAMPAGAWEPFLNILINALAHQAASFILVLDDFHVLYSRPVLELLTYLLEHAPPDMHLLLLSRSDPPLPLARLRARGQLLEIRASDLCFTAEEATRYLNQGMGLNLSPEDIDALEKRTEGWIAGLQLAAVSMRAVVDKHGFVSAFTGSHHYIMDYLTDEVIRFQPERVNRFLLQTSILSKMCASLCEAVVESDGGEPADGQAMLEALEEMNLFLIPLDDRRRWYRYHHLFAEVLQLRLEQLYPQQLPELHRRASRWCEQNACMNEAIDHALLAEDQARAAQLVAEHGCSLLLRGEGFNLLKWVEAVEPYVQKHPWLAILKAWALALTGQPGQVEQILRRVEAQISRNEMNSDMLIMIGSIASVRAFLANLQGETLLAADHAQRALESLPGDNDFSCSLRSVAISILGDSSWMNGDMEEAKRAYLEAEQASQAAGNIYMTMIADSNLADVLLEQGQLRQAEKIYSETLQIAARPDGQKLPLADRLYIGLGEIAYEWDRLETAVDYLQQSIEICQQLGNVNLLAKGFVMLARVERARGNLEKAREALQAAERISSDRRLSPLRRLWVKLASAHWWLEQGNLERAAALVQEVGISSEGVKSGIEIPYRLEPEYYLLLRLLLARGEGEAALSLSKPLLVRAEATKRTGRMIEALVLQALAWQEKNGLAEALLSLERAFSLAQPEGYVRVFADEGPLMRKLLYQARAHRIGADYPSRLLAAMESSTDQGEPPAQALIEPLTRRELEVLQLIESGCSNQEIADRLAISLPTVKRHLSNIYAKLGAGSRTQAVSLGRELRLFE